MQKVILLWKGALALFLCVENTVPFPHAWEINAMVVIGFLGMAVLK
jgi:hypothetical protein